MKKIHSISVIFLICAIFLLLIVWRSNTSVDVWERGEIIDSGETEDFEYDVYPNNVVEITKYKGENLNVIIPEKINNKKVISIGDNVFRNNKSNHIGSLSSIVIPNSITYIGNYAFFATGLTNIELPDGLTYIGDYAFDRCSMLKSILVPKSVRFIGENAFHRFDIHEYLEFDGHRIYTATAHDGVTIICSKDSYVHHYCVENNIKEELIDENTSRRDNSTISTTSSSKSIVSSKYVVDETGILNDGTIQSIDELIKKLYSSVKAEIYFVIEPCNENTSAPDMAEDFYKKYDRGSFSRPLTDKNLPDMKRNSTVIYYSIPYDYGIYAGGDIYSEMKNKIDNIFTDDVENYFSEGKYSDSVIALISALSEFYEEFYE